MKKVLGLMGIVLTIAVCLAAFVAYSGAVVYAVDEPDFSVGTELDPCEISSPESLLALSDYVAGGGATYGVYYKVTAPIALESGFTPIGNAGNPFNGRFDGGFHAITLSVSADSYGGLFGYVGLSGVVENVVTEGNVTASTEHAGGIAAYNAGIIRNVFNSASVSANTRVGGIVGENIGLVESAVNYGGFTVSSYGGGIVGVNGDAGSVLNSVNLGEAETFGGTSSVVGGVAGSNAGLISDVYNAAAINVTGERIGSVVGYLLNAKQGSGRVYNLSSASSRNVVGFSEITVPETFTALSLYAFLSGEAIFSENGLVRPAFEEGKGYLHAPSFAEKEGFKDYFERSLFAAGDGSEALPYVINDEQNWNLFAVNSALFSYEGKFVRLNVSLNLGEITPLFTAEGGFGGNFNGGGNLISFSVTSSDDYVGLFAKIGQKGSVNALRLSAVVSGGNYVGALAGYSLGTVSSINTEQGSVNGNTYVGGLIGKIENGVISEVGNKAAVTGTRYVGGIAGEAVLASGVSSLVNEGTVSQGSGNAYAYFGGIFGRVQSEGIAAEKLYVYGQVSAYKADYVGGVAGSVANCKISEAAVVNSVTGRNYVGGIVGTAASSGEEISFAMVVGNVSGAKRTGGIIGDADSFAGGIVGSPLVTETYFYGTFATVPEAETDINTFRAIAPDGVDVRNSYYLDGVLTLSGKGTAINSVEFTEGLFADDSTAWVQPAQGVGFGYLPRLNGAFADDDSRLKVNYFGGGEGTDSLPFIVNSASHLYNLSYLAANYETYRSAFYLQSAEITLEKQFSLSDSEETAFCGTYDGGYYALRSVFDGHNPLFGYIGNGGVVKNVAVEGGVYENASIVGTILEGGLLTDSYSTASVNASADFVGGLVAVNYGIIESSFFTGRAEGAATIGGVAGKNYGEINNCFFAGLLNGSVAGGIAGENDGGTIFGAVASGTVYAYGSGSVAGGLVGKITMSVKESAVSQSYVTAIIESDGKRGGLAGEVYSTFNLGSAVFYNGDIFTASIAFYRGESATPGGIYAKTSAEMLSGFESNFTQANFVSNLSPDKDSGYSPRNAVFENTGIARVEELSAYALKIRSFGWDNESLDEWGTSGNPYLITTLAEMNVLRNNVDAGYDYSGNYFRLDADIDFGDVPFRPIGRFISAANPSNRVFGGVFDGNGHKFSSLIISEQAGYGYAALFAYTSKGFELRNLILDETCSVTSLGTDAASFVGYNNGLISHCFSYATVSSQSRVGGITVFTANSTTINDTVFAGTLSAPTAFGLTAQEAGTVTINSYNSWYLKKNIDGSFVQAGKEGYVHNNYGNVLFEDRGGVVVIDVTENGFTFSLTAETGYKGVLMNAQDKVEFDGNGVYDPTVNPNVTASGATKLYARFVLSVELADVTFLREGEGSYGGGEYYRGQNVTFTLALQYGKFLNAFDTNGLLNDITYGNNNSDCVTVTFAVPEEGYGTNSENNYVLTLNAEVFDFADYATFVTPSDSTYDGSAKVFTVAPTADNEGFFGENDFTYTDLSTQGIVTSIINAGSYRIKVSLKKAGDEHFCGYVTEEYVVAKKVLTVADYESEKALWESFVSKVYDNKTSSVKELPADLISGVISSDAGKVEVSASLTWEKASAGETLATVTCSAISGTASGNYSLTEVTLTGIAASIARMTLTVTLNVTESEYTGVSPTANYTLDGTLYGTAALKFEFVPQTLPEDGSKKYDAGIYTVEVSCTDSENYVVAISGATEYTITPKTVKEEDLHYSVPVLMYDGSDLSSLINITFRKLSGGDGKVTAIFYKLNDESETLVSSVKDAGNYEAELSVNDKNYTLDANVGRYAFEVLRSDKGGEIEVSLSDGGNFENMVLTYGEGIAITPGELYGADLQVERTVNGRGEAKVTLSENGDYLLELTRYSLDGTLTFRFKATNSPNYEDRYSEEYTIKVEAGIIYVGVKEETVYYGDVIDLTLVYSTDEAQSDVIATETVAGFVPSMYEVENKGELKAGSYDVSFYGGDSDGYVFRTSYNNTLTITPRPVEIRTNIEIGEETNGKIYGEQDSFIKYKVYDKATNLVTDSLPNGKAVTFNGFLSRAEGEKAGSYEILQGSLTSANNPDYDIVFSATHVSEYVIAKRDIEFIVDEVEKDYGQPDPIITFRPNDGYSFMFDDGAESVTVSVTRQPGENVGEYAYTLSGYDGGNNYRIVSVDYSSNKFRINKATPTVTFVPDGTLRYGNALSSLRLSGSAIDAYGKAVQGTFSWIFPDTKCGVGENTLAAMFTPDTSNFAAVRSDNVIVNVLPRIAEVVFEGVTEYVYNGEVQGEFTATLSNAVGDDKVQLIADKVTSINAGEYYYTVRLSEDETRYVLEGGASIKYVIYPALLTVSVKSATFKEGDVIKTEIVYDGFVGGDNESVLDSKPSVDPVASAGGIYYVTPKGGADKNYEFIYLSGTITVNKTSISDTFVTMEGDFGATASLTVVKAASIGLSIYQEQLDKALNYNIFLPNSRYLSGYYELRYGEISAEEIVYTVSLALNEGDKIYLVKADGSVEELTDYKEVTATLKTSAEGTESSENLVTVTFTAEPVYGIAVYSSKAATDLITDYIPLGATVIGVVVVVGVVAVIIAVNRKKKERERKYMEKFKD